MEVGARHTVNNRTVDGNHGVVPCGEPPIREHPWESANKSSEQKQVAELDGHNGTPGQNEGNCDLLLEEIRLLNEIPGKRDLDKIARLGGTNDVHLVNNDE